MGAGAGEVCEEADDEARVAFVIEVAAAYGADSEIAGDVSRGAVCAYSP